LYFVKKSAIMALAIFNGSKEVNMVSKGNMFFGGEVPKSLISLSIGILGATASLLALGSFITNPINTTSGFAPDDQSRLSMLLIGMTAGFGLGVVSWIAACDVFPGDKSQPHWRMCRVCASVGIGFGILAILGYLAFITLLPVLLPLPK
jgi:hypothetical protein